MEETNSPSSSSPEQAPHTLPEVFVPEAASVSPRPEQGAGEQAPNPETATQPPRSGAASTGDDQQDDGVSADAQQPPAATAAPGPASDDMPAAADDVDVIEMEWVKKAKQLIQETKDDPHAQEQAMEKLQVEYLRKRYGKEIKTSR